MKQNTEKEVLTIVRTITRDAKSDKELLTAEYLDEGIIDSFQLVEMITMLEGHFKVKFSAGELTSQQFRTLKGVASIVEENGKNKKK